MGLDNGVVIRPKTEKGRNYLERNFPGNRNGEKYEFGYWRKCLNIREKFIDDFNYDEEEQKIFFGIIDIPDIINTLKYFLNEDNWYYKGRASLIFNWYEEIASIANAISDLYHFIDYIDEGADNEDDITDEDFEIYFYDSY